MLDFCKERKDISAVVVHKLDRFSRNLFDYATVKTILKKQNIRLVSQVEKLYQTLQLNEPFVKYLREKLERKVNEIEDKRKRELGPPKRKRTELRERLVKIADFLAQGRIDMGVYEGLKRKYNEELFVAENRVVSLDTDVSWLTENFDKSAAVAGNLYRLHQKFSYDQRKRLLYAVFKRKILLPRILTRRSICCLPRISLLGSTNPMDLSPRVI